MRHEPRRSCRNLKLMHVTCKVSNMQGLTMLRECPGL